MALSQWPPWQTEKKRHYQKWRPHKATRLFLKQMHAKEERNGPLSANQGLFIAKPRSSHAVCTLWVHPTTSPCPALSAGVNLIPRTLPEVTSQAQLQLKSLVVKGLTIPANYSPKDTIAKTASQCQQLLQALGHDKSFNDYAKQSSTNSLLKGICYFDNYIFHQSCNCWHGFMGRY